MYLQRAAAKNLFVFYNCLSRRDNIYPQNESYFPGEINFDPFSQKKNQKKVSLTGFEPATVEKSG
jgi:hypothetical protein